MVRRRGFGVRFFWGAEWMPKEGREVVGDEDERKIGWVMDRFGG
jgi:hypothetical protein